MIEGARRTASALGLDNLTYTTSDLRQAEFGDPDAPVDLVIAVFLFNYMDTAAMSASCPGCGPCSSRAATSSSPCPIRSCRGSSPPEAVLHAARRGYLSSVDVPSPVASAPGWKSWSRVIHKTFTTYFQALHAAGYGHAARRGSTSPPTTWRLTRTSSVRSTCPCTSPFPSRHDPDPSFLAHLLTGPSVAHSPRPPQGLPSSDSASRRPGAGRVGIPASTSRAWPGPSPGRPATPSSPHRPAGRTLNCAGPTW